MARKDSSRGKAWERAAAAMFGLRRRRNGEGMGYDDCVTLDGRLAPVSIEAKAYSTLQLQTKWVEQARRNAGERPWIIAQRPKGWRRPVATVDLTWLRDVCILAGVIELEEEHESHEGPSPNDPDAPVGAVRGEISE